jgi:hypothetical protein
MGALLGGPNGPPADDTDAREQRDAWHLWRSVVDRLTTDVRVAAEAEARTSLERRYLAGHDVLFADAAMAWAGHVEFVERLAGFAEILTPGEPAKTGPRKPDRSGVEDSFGAQVEALAGRLADDARVRPTSSSGSGSGPWRSWSAAWAPESAWVRPHIACRWSWLA